MPYPSRIKNQYRSDGEQDPERLWKIEDLPGKGKGLIATNDITPGTLVMSESYLITTEVVTDHDEDVTEKDLEKALKSLSLESQHSYRSLHNNFPEDTKHPLSGIVRSNAYPLGIDSEHGGVFPNISRINHSCLPNVVQYWNELAEKEEVHAVRPITKGEEITTSYHQFGTSEERKQLLKAHFRFNCACILCSLPPEELQASDERLSRAQELDDIIGNSEICYYEPEKVLNSCRSQLKIYEQEGIKDGRLARLYYDAFQLCNMHADLARARCFAKYYCNEKKIAEGSDSINVLEMKPFVKNPARHGSYEPMGKWKTGTSDVPRGLNSMEFSKWLWREGV